MRISLLSLVLLVCIGCSEPVKQTPLSENAVKMEKALEGVSKEDTLLVYYLFDGVSEYVGRYDGIRKNNEAFTLFKVVKTRYGKEDKWLDKEGLDPNDVLEAELLKLKFDTPQEFTEESRKAFVKLFKEFGDGALKSYKGKSDAR